MTKFIELTNAKGKKFLCNAETIQMIVPVLENDENDKDYFINSIVRFNSKDNHAVVRETKEQILDLVNGITPTVNKHDDENIHEYKLKIYDYLDNTNHVFVIYENMYDNDAFSVYKYLKIRNTEFEFICKFSQITYDDMVVKTTYKIIEEKRIK